MSASLGKESRRPFCPLEILHLVAVRQFIGDGFLPDVDLLALTALISYLSPNSFCSRIVHRGNFYSASYLASKCESESHHSMFQVWIAMISRVQTYAF